MTIEDRITTNISLAHKLARAFEHCYCRIADYDELAAAAIYGLTLAANRFEERPDLDDESNRRIFAAYAIQYIKGQIYRAITNQDLVHVPEHEAIQLRKAGRAFTSKDIMSINTMNHPEELDFFAEDDPMPIDGIEELLSRLHWREATVIKHRYGLNGDGKPHTQEEVAVTLNVSRQRCGQIEKRAMRKLKSILAHRDEIYN